MAGRLGDNEPGLDLHNELYKSISDLLTYLLSSVYTNWYELEK